MTELHIENQRGYKILSALLSTDRTGQSVDIAGSILDFDIYEHLDKPYLTANFVFNDNYGLVEQIDMQGVELLTLTLESQNSNVIFKNFRIVRISRATKGGDRSEMVFIDTIEEHAYISNAKNVNKCYVGTPASIISTVAKEHLNKNVNVTGTSYQGNMKVIVPNKTPLDTIKWIQQRATNSDGLPYYVYSTLVEEDLQFEHLGDMLQKTPNNADRPYVYSQAPSGYGNNTKEYFTIESYKYENVEDMFSMIRKGFAGADYQFLNLSHGFLQRTHFDAEVDVFDNIKDKSYLSKTQDNPNYPIDTMIGSNTLGQQPSKVFTKISAADTYAGSGDFKTYSEEMDGSAYKKNIVGDALKHYMTKAPLSINVNGTPFLMGGHLTIGTVLRIKFFDSNIAVDRPGQEVGIDTKKSGDYIVYAARHSFKIEKYDMNLLLSKVANYTGETL